MDPLDIIELREYESDQALEQMSDAASIETDSLDVGPHNPQHPRPSNLAKPPLSSEEALPLPKSRPFHRSGLDSRSNDSNSFSRRRGLPALHESLFPLQFATKEAPSSLRTTMSDTATISAGGMMQENLNGEPSTNTVNSGGFIMPSGWTSSRSVAVNNASTSNWNAHSDALGHGMATSASYEDAFSDALTNEQFEATTLDSDVDHHTSTQVPSETQESPENARAINARQRSHSEPDAGRMRNTFFQNAWTNTCRAKSLRPRSERTLTPRRRQSRNCTSELAMRPSATAADSQNYPRARSTLDRRHAFLDSGPSTRGSGTTDSPSRFGSNAIGRAIPDDNDAMNQEETRRARSRWITINRRFQFVVNGVAMFLSYLLLAILLCWVVLTSSYVVAIDKSCDVPLKLYYWLVTFQLIMDVFRTDIMRLCFRWDPSSSSQIPTPVIVYNICYLVYAFFSLQMGIRSVFVGASTCPLTASDLFRSSKVYVALSITAWATIIFGYVVPFVVVATLLTFNGYTPVSDQPREGPFGNFTIFPVSMGAPPSCIDKLSIVSLADFPEHYPIECCICMEKFKGSDTIVETGCQHVFHKQCCRMWLRQSRTCPVCRTDIPSTLTNGDEEIGIDQPSGYPRYRASPAQYRVAPSSPFAARQDFQHELENLIHLIQENNNLSEG